MFSRKETLGLVDVRIYENVALSGVERLEDKRSERFVVSRAENIGSITPDTPNRN